MDKTDYHDKMDALVNDKQTYEELKRDPTPALQRKLNSTLLTLKKTNAIDTQRYYRLRCSVPQPPKLYGLPKLHKPGFPMRPIVSFCVSPTCQLSKYLKTILQPLTDKSRRKLQSTEDFINTTKTVQIPDDYKLVSFDVESLSRSIAPTATPPTSVRPAKTSQPDWLNTNERRGKAMSTITLLNITDLRTTLLTGTLRNA